MGISHAELIEKGDDQVDLLLAYIEVEHDTGPHGQIVSEATSEVANPNYYGEGAVRYIPHHLTDYAEAAVEQDRKEQELPPGAIVFVERKEY